MSNMQRSFADLNQSQLQQIRAVESDINSQLDNNSKEVILLAYTKPSEVQ
ncbi:MAG TPA: hypothetical protein VFF14_10305 [Candidatus Deferrimicrobium sp.]|nr:hypothetical protein [Candidatus Deferrimicrobium sp.]